MIRLFLFAARSFGWLFAAGFFVVVITPVVRAGPVLLSRESDLRLSGVSEAGEYLLSIGSADLAPFNDRLISDPGAAAAASSARQESSPRFDPQGVLSGARAEGSARAFFDPGARDAFAEAETSLDLVFRIHGAPTVFTFDGTLAASGDAAGGALLNPKGGDDTSGPLMNVNVAGEIRSVRHSTVLEPGTYRLSVWAFAGRTAADSEASYSMSMFLKDGEPGVVPMPLPTGVWGGLAGLSVVAMLTHRSRKRKSVARPTRSDSDPEGSDESAVW